MQLTNKEVKSLLTDLYCKASQDDAIDMREFAVLMEGIREAVAHKNGCQSLKRLTINRQKYDTPVYWPYLIDFKKAIGQLLYKNAVAQITEARHHENDAFTHWLNEYANALVHWVGAVYIPLCREDFGFSGAEKESQEQYSQLNQFVLDRKWVETYPFFTKLAADNRIDTAIRSTLETLAGQVQLYWMTDADRSIRHFEKARELNKENHIAIRCLGEHYAKKLEMETARPYMLDAISMEPNDLYNYLVVGDSYRDEQKYHVAEQWYTDAYNKNFLDSDVYERFIDLYTYNDYKSSDNHSLAYWIEKATNIIKDGEYENDQYHLLKTIGNVLSKNGQAAEGRIYFDQAISLRPQLTSALIDKGYSYGAENDFIHAEACFQQSLAFSYGTANADGYYGLGWLYEKQEKRLEAIAHYQKCMHERPAWKDQMCNIIGNLYFSLHNFTEAARYFEEAINTNANEPVYWDNLKDAVEKSGQKELELSYLQKALKQFPANAEYYNKLGIFYYNQQQFQEATRNYSDAIKLSPETAVYYENRALALSEDGLIEEAIADLKKAFANEPEDALNNRIGVLLINIKKYAEALPYLQNALQECNTKALYFSNVAFAYEMLQQLEKAIENYNNAIAIDAGNANYYNRIGIIYFNQKDYEQAAIYFNQATVIDPETTCYLENAGMAFYNQGNYQKAKEVYEKLAQKLTGEAYVFYKLAELNTLLEFNGAALEAIDKAIGLEEDNASYLLLKCLVLEKTERYEEAISLYTHILELNVERDVVLNRIGLMHYNIGTKGKTEHFREAVKFYLQAIETNPLQPVYYQNLGLAYRYLNAFTEAEEAYLKSLEMEPENAAYQNYVGLLYFDWADYEKALLYFTKAAALDVDNRVYADNIKLAADLLSQKNTTAASN